MAKTSEVAAPVAVPSAADIERAAEFAREPFLLEGEGPEALAPGPPRRERSTPRSTELDEGAESPSIEWRQNFSLLLGLERLLAEEPPKLRDGAELNPHQVDALSGTLTELIAEQQVALNGGGRNGGNGSAAEATAAAAEDDADRRRRTTAPTSDGGAARGRGARRRRGAAGLGGSRRARTRSRSPRRPRTPAPRAASGSSTRPAPARRSPRSASSTPPAPAAS